MIILGIDPGSRITGYGVIDSDGRRSRFVAGDCIHAVGEDGADRLRAIFDGLCAVMEAYHPEICAIEQVFMARNANSALKLGQARGAAICAVVRSRIAIHEYSTRSVKQAVTGRGGADKAQVQHMVKCLLNLREVPAADAADALAVALCHAHTQVTLGRIENAGALSR